LRVTAMGPERRRQGSQQEKQHPACTHRTGGSALSDPDADHREAHPRTLGRRGGTHGRSRIPQQQAVPLASSPARAVASPQNPHVSWPRWSGPVVR
jgi:hypothetical protein